MLKNAVRKCLTAFQRLVLAFARHIVPSAVVAGIRIVDAASLTAVSHAAERIKPALDLLQTTDPRRFNRVRRNIPELVVIPISGAEYSFHLRTCFIGHVAANQGSPESLALMLIHESTHAELHRRGFEMTPITHGRHEKLCIKEELRFTRRLNDTRWVSLVGQRLNEIPSRADEVQARITEIAAAGMPKWYQRLVAYANSPDVDNSSH
jgi:hypothetical protein